MTNCQIATEKHIQLSSVSQMSIDVVELTLPMTTVCMVKEVVIIFNFLI